MDEYNNLKSTAKQKGNEAIEESKEKISSAYETVKDNAESLANQVQDTVADYYSEGKKKVDLAYDATCKQKDHLIEMIKDKPLTSVFIAAGIGYLLSHLKNK